MNSKQIIQTIFINIIKITVVVVLVALLYKGGAKAYHFGYEVFSEESAEMPPGRMFEVTIVQGKSVADVAEMLEEYELINSSETYRIREWFSSEQGEMKPGVYELNTSMLPSEMITILAGEKEEVIEEQVLDEEPGEDILEELLEEEVIENEE